MPNENLIVPNLFSEEPIAAPKEDLVIEGLFTEEAAPEPVPMAPAPIKDPAADLENTMKAKDQAAAAQVQQADAMAQAAKAQEADPKNWNVEKVKEYYKANPPQNIEQAAQAKAAIKIKQKQEDTAAEAIMGEEMARAPLDYGPISEDQLRAQVAPGIPDAKRAKAVEQGFLKGLTGMKEDYPELSNDHPALSGMADLTGNLLGLTLAGGITGGVGKKILSEGLAKYGIANLPKIMTTARVAQGGATFGTKEAFNKSIKALTGEGVSKEDAKDIVKSIAFGATFGGIDSLPKIIMRVPAQALLGFTTAKMEGAKTPEALLNGAIFGAFGLLNRANLDQEYKKMGLEKISKTIASRGVEVGMKEGEAKAAGEYFVNKSILNATGEKDINKAWQKVSEDPKITLKYLDDVDKFLRDYKINKRLPSDITTYEVRALPKGTTGPGVEPNMAPGPETPKPEIPVVRVKVADIKTDPGKFQFKMGADEAGVQTPLKGEWNEYAAGNLLLYETKNGDLYAVNAHHRTAHAKAKGVDSVNAQILREADGITPEQARAIGAETNILEGRGTIYDHAEYFKNTPDLTEKDVKKKGISQAGFNIGTKASDNTYYNFKAKKISPEAAEAIAITAPKDDTIQAAGVSFAIKNPKVNPIEIEAFTKAISMEKPTKSEQGDLFGFDDSAIRAAEAKAKVVASNVDKLKEELSALRFAKSDEKVAISKKYGVNIEDPKAVRVEITRIEDEIGRYQKWYSYPDITEKVNVGAVEAAAKVEETKKAADLKAAMKEYNVAARQKNEAGKTEAQKKIAALKPASKSNIVEYNGKQYRRVPGSNVAWDFNAGKGWSPVKSLAIKDELNTKFPIVEEPMYEGLKPETKKALEKEIADTPDLVKGVDPKKVNAIAKEAEALSAKVEGGKQAELDKILKDVATKHNATGEIISEVHKTKHVGYFGTPKSAKSMVIKVLRKLKAGRKDYSVASMKDHARGSIYVKTWEEVPAIIKDLKSRGYVVENTIGKPLNDFGYRGINITLSLGDGVNGEIQIHTPSSWEKKLWSDKIYQPFRKYEGVDYSELDPNVFKEIKSAKELSVKEWSDYFEGVSVETKAAISEASTGTPSVIIPKTIPSDLDAGTKAPSLSKENPVSPQRTILPSNNLVKETSDIVISPSSKSLPQEEKPVKSAMKEVGSEVDKTIEEMDKARQAGSVSIGGAVPSAAKARGDDTIIGAGGVSFDPKIEARWKAAKGIKEEFLPARIYEGIKDFFRQFKEFPYLENKPEYAQFKNDLRMLSEAKAIAQDKAIRALDGITFNLGKKKLDLFTRKVVLDDLTYEASRGHDLPFGFTPETLKVEKAKIDAIVAQNSDIAAALDRRSTLLEAIKKELVDAGIMSEEAFRNPSYFRHQVLEYMEAQKALGRGKFKKGSPAYAKKREGSSLDINTDYLQAEFEWLSNAMKDIEVFKAIDRLENSPINIKPQLEAQAKLANAQGLIGREEELAPYRKKIAIGFSTLRKLGYLPGPQDLDFVGFDTMGELASIAEGSQGEEEDAVISARMVLKAIADRKKAIKDILGDEYKTWKDLIPEGYGLWQPKKGNLFFSGKSVSQAILDRIVEAAGSEIGISQDDLRNITIMGPKLKELVLPQEIIDTIEDNYSTMPKSALDKIVDVGLGWPMKIWKAQILFGPTRFFKYNYQNLIGDLSGLVAGNPQAITKVPRSVGDLWKYFKDPSGAIDPMLQDAIDRGVISTSLSVQELPEINQLDIFKRYQDLNLRDKLNVVKLWFTGASKFTRFREAVLRYATYIDYLDKIETGEYGSGPFKAFKYGASRPEEVEGLADPRDKAAKLSRELLVDYGAITPGGKFLRKNVIPFYSWLEGNFKRYNRLFANASREGIGSGSTGGSGRVAGVAAAQAGAQAAGYAGLWALRFAMFYAAAQAWNMLFHKDEEARVKDYDKRRLHIVLGTDPDTGDIMVLRGQDAFGDFAEWFGLNTIPSNLERLSRKEISIADMAADMARSPYAKLLNGIGPGIKYPMALMTGREYNPDTGKSTPIRDIGQYTARTLAVEGLYNRAAGKPHRTTAKDLETGFISRQDPQENAYSYIQSKKGEWNEKMGRGGSGDYYTPRSKLYQDYKKALKYGDQEAAAQALNELQALGVKKKELIKSLKTADPLYGIPKKERKAFVNNFLTQEDRGKLIEAYGYYNRVFRGK